jgi:CheY-like chemotaxis protein
MTALPAAPRQDIGAPRVLCVDDNRELTDSYELLLGACGYDVAACYDGATAVRLAATFRPHVCVFDLSLPGMDGDEIARRVRSLPGLPTPYLICVTAQTDEGARRRCRDAGFHAMLRKPVDPIDLFRHLPIATRRPWVLRPAEQRA